MTPILKPVLDRLRAASWPEVQEIADGAGVPFHTLAKLKRGETENPRVKTVEQLLTYFAKRPKAKAAA